MAAHFCPYNPCPICSPGAYWYVGFPYYLQSFRPISFIKEELPSQFPHPDGSNLKEDILLELHVAIKEYRKSMTLVNENKVLGLIDRLGVLNE